jgi:hypothetical protein
MRDIRIELPGTVRRVRAVALARDLAATETGSWSSVTLPGPAAYEVLDIERQGRLRSRVETTPESFDAD